MIRSGNIYATLLLITLHFSIRAQVHTDTIYFASDGIDAHVYSGSSGTNYGSDSILMVYYDYSPTYHHYTYLQADMSGIPANAIVLDASLNLYAGSVNNGADHSMYIDRITTSWTESGITWASVPGATSVGRISIPHAQTTTTGWQQLYLTNLAQYSVANPTTNYGWRIINQVTSGTIDKGVIYASSENAATAHRPYVIVEWQMPLIDTIYFTKDAKVYSDSTATNYGTDDTMSVTWDYPTAGYATRSFFEADISSIPRNAIVVDAFLNLYALSVDNDTTHPYFIHAPKTSWTEDGITWANQPTAYHSASTSVGHTLTDSAGWHQIPFDATAQYSIRVPETYYGWRMALQTESGPQDKGAIYISSEHDSTQWRPYVTIEYEMPIEIEGFVTHCTNGNDDGAVKIEVSGGCGSYISYSFRKVNSDGSLSAVESGTFINDADVSGLQNALYMFEVTDYRGVTGYRYFFVGEEGVSTDVEFVLGGNNYGTKYNEDAWVVYNKNPVDSFATGPGVTTFGCHTNSTYDSRAVVQWQVDWDPSLEFTSARHALRNKGGCYQTSTSDNDAWVSRITEFWEEDYVTWAIRPTTTTDNRVYIPTTITNGYENRNDTFNILGFIPHWQEHPDESFGYELSLNDYTQANTAHRDYSSYDYIGQNLMVSFTPKPRTETSYNDTTQLGDIIVNTNSGAPSYNYFITTYAPLPVLDTIWYNIKDSLGIDSVQFYQGHSTARSFTFENLPADRYYIGVYNNTGTKIMDEVVYLKPSLRIADTTDIIISGDTLFVDTLSANHARAVHFNTIPMDDYGGAEIEIIQLDAEIALGFNNTEEPTAIYEGDYEYAIRVETDGDVVFLKDGESFGTSTASIGDQFRLIKESSQVSFYKNGVRVHSYDFRETHHDDFKTEVFLKGQAGAVVFKPVGKVGPKPKVSAIHAECGEHLGSFVIKPSSYHGFSLGNYSLVNQLTLEVVASGTVTTSTITHTNIPVGIYNLTTYWSNGITSLLPVTTEVVIAYPVLWEEFVNISFVPFSMNTIEPTSQVSVAIAVSVNSVPYNQGYWVQFEHRKENTANSSIYFEIRDMGNGHEAIVKIFSYWGMKLVQTTSSAGVEQLEPGLPFVTLAGSAFQITTGEPIRIIHDNGELTLKYQGYEMVVFNSGVDDNVNLVSWMHGDVQTIRTLASFCHPIASPYVKLRRTLDGGHYLANEGILKVEYDEEYNDSELEFYVYEEVGNTQLSESYWTLTPISYGDNRLSFSFVGTECLANGYYILEIVNKKNEKRYLRFKIVNSTC